MSKNEIIDNYKSKNKYYKNRKDLLQMGKKEQWVVIDLRPLIKGYYYYPQKYKLKQYVEELVKRYDVLVIPKIEEEPTPNYNRN